MPTKDLPIVDRASTGVVGLDEILQGGLPRGNVYLVQGDPGVGKTTLALQFLLAGARIGERVIYITLTESRKELLSVAESHGWNLTPVAVVDMAVVKEQASGNQTFFHPNDVYGEKFVKQLQDEIESSKAVRVVFDSLSQLRLFANDALRYRYAMLRLKDFFAERKATVLLLDDKSPSTPDDLQLDGIVHGSIGLEKATSDFGAEHRRLRIGKLRGSQFRGGYHNYVIEPGGLVVFPRLASIERRKPRVNERCSTGIAALDALLGGGLDRGTSNLLSGPTGTGKTTFALRFVYEAAKRGEKAKIYSFEESTDTMVSRCQALGMDLQPYLDIGAVTIRQVDPGELSPGEFGYHVRQGVTDNDARVVVVDSLNGYLNAMPDERFLTIQLHELLAHLGQKNVITLLTTVQQGVLGADGSPIELSYMADTVVTLRYFEAWGRVKRAISVVKKRSGPHEDTIREFKIDAGGIVIGEPLTDFQGVLSGIPTFYGAKERML